jgi:hypothetical protein
MVQSCSRGPRGRPRMSSNGAPERRAHRTSPRRRPRASTFHQDEGGGAAPCRSPRAPNASDGWIAPACEPRLCRCSSRSPRCSPTHPNRAGSSLIRDISQRGSQCRPSREGDPWSQRQPRPGAASRGLQRSASSALPLWEPDISVLRCRCAKRQRGTPAPPSARHAVARSASARARVAIWHWLVAPPGSARPG